MLKNDYFFALTGISAVCLLILVGGYRYSGGEILPTNGDVASWMFTLVVIGIPAFTLSWWLFDLVRRRVR